MSATPGTGWRTRAVAPALLAGVLALFFLPALATTDQFLTKDSAILHHPAKRWIAERWAAGALPAWNPFAGLGFPEVSGGVDAVLHPLNLALVALPYESGFKAWVLLSFLAAALGARALARALGCGWHAQVAAGLGFALSGHLVSSSDNLTYLTSLAFLPWMLAAGLAFQARPTPARLAGVGLASALCAAGGDPQAWGFAVLALGPALLLLPAEAPGALARRLGRAAGAVALAVVAAAPLWLPILRWLPHSSRAANLAPAATAHWDLLPRRLLETVIPNLLRAPPGTLVSPALDAFTGGTRAGLPWVASIYFGVSALLLAGAGALLDRRARLLVAAAATFTWMACGVHLGFATMASRLPVLGGFRYWEKLFVWPTLFTVLAAALGFDALLRAEPRVRRRFALAAGAAACLLLLAWVAAGQWPLLALDSLVPRRPADAGAAGALVENAVDGLGLAALACALLAAVATATAVPRLARLAPALLLAAAVVDPFAANGHAYGLSPAQAAGQDAPLAVALRREPGPARVFTPFEISRDRWPELGELASGYRWAERTLRPAWNVAQHLGNLDPYTGMVPRALHELRLAVPAAQLGAATGLWGISAVPVPSRVELAASIGLAPPYQVLAADEELPCFLVAVPHRPRAYLAEAVASTTPDGAQEATLALPPASTRSVVEGPVPPGLTAPRGEVRLAEDLPERVVVEAQTDRLALLILNDQAAPGWTARLDGAEVPVVTANLLVRGVWLGAGRHLVEFTYRTPGLAEGAWLAVAAFAAIGVWAEARRRAGRAEAPAASG